MFFIPSFMGDIMSVESSFDKRPSTSSSALELESRLEALQLPENQGEDLDRASWIWLLALGVVLPALVFAWGW